MLGPLTAGEPAATVISAYSALKHGFRFESRNHLCSNYPYSHSAVVTEQSCSDGVLVPGTIPYKMFNSARTTATIFPIAPVNWAYAGMTQSK